MKYKIIEGDETRYVEEINKFKKKKKKQKKKII